MWECPFKPCSKISNSTNHHHKSMSLFLFITFSCLRPISILQYYSILTYSLTLLSKIHVPLKNTLSSIRNLRHQSISSPKLIKHFLQTTMNITLVTLHKMLYKSGKITHFICTTLCEIMVSLFTMRKNMLSAEREFPFQQHGSISSLQKEMDRFIFIS